LPKGAVFCGATGAEAGALLIKLSFLELPPAVEGINKEDVIQSTPITAAKI